MTIDAAELLEQYAISPSETLLVLDEDSPYEEQLHLVLAKGSKIRDHILIGAPYTAGVFRIVGVGDRIVQFRFEGDAVWSVTVRSHPSRGFGGLPHGSRRRGGLFAKRYLDVKHGGKA